MVLWNCDQFDFDLEYNCAKPQIQKSCCVKLVMCQVAVAVTFLLIVYNLDFMSFSTFFLRDFMSNLCRKQTYELL